MRFDHINNCVLFIHHPHKGDNLGYFDPGDNNIYISKKLSLSKRECIYLHEKAHQEHYKEKCWCWDMSSDFWAEYHAMKEELLQVKARGGLLLKQAYLRLVKRTLTRAKENPKTWGVHGKAMKRVMKTKAFKEFAK